MGKTKVLVMVDWFEPGFKAGGPIRSAVNFVDHLEEDLDIYVFTSDRDLGDYSPYPGIQADQWIKINHHRVFYSSPSGLSWKKILDVITGIKPDYIYLNSMFSYSYAIYPQVMKMLGKIDGKIVLAPRGMLKASAMAHKAIKKKIFINLFKALGFPKKVMFHVTDKTEERDVVNTFGKNVVLFCAGNLPGKQKPLSLISGKSVGELKMVFVGRIHPIKNLDFLLKALNGIKGNIELTVIAHLEDQQYWNKCLSVISSLSPGINVTLLENEPHEKIAGIIMSNHIFALPTKGENFGHAIFESLSVGRPVLISDQTPWRNLETAKAGWDLSLDNGENFRQIIQDMVQMNTAMLNEWCRGAWNHANNYLHRSDLKQSYLNQFT